MSPVRRVETKVISGRWSNSLGFGDGTIVPVSERINHRADARWFPSFLFDCGVAGVEPTLGTALDEHHVVEPALFECVGRQCTHRTSLA